MSGSTASDAGEVLVKDDRVVWRDPVGIERVRWDGAGVGPSKMAVQVLRSRAALRIKGQERKAISTRCILDRSHQTSAKSRSTASPVDQQLRDLSAVRLVRRPRRVKLHRAHDLIAIARDEEDRARVSCRERLAPPVFGAVDRQRREKAYGSARLDRVDKEPSERPDIGVTDRRCQLLDQR